MLEKLKTNSRTTEVDAASTNMITVFDGKDWSADTHLTAIFTSLKTETSRLNLAINRSKAQSVLDEKDEIRDVAVRSLYYLIIGYAHNPDDGIKAAAEALLLVLNNYGLSVTEESYVSETSLVNSMITDFKDTELQAHIVLLPGCAVAITSVENAQDDFNNTFVAYEADKAEEGTLENATTIKKEVVSIINNKLVVYLRAMEQVDEPTYGEFARTLAQIIADNNEQVKKRYKKTTA